MSSYRFAVDVMPRDGILDPQGRAVENALPQLGASSVHGVRVGRRVELTIEAPDRSEARELLERLARCPNQYVTHLDLLRDVWEDEYTATATIRSLVRQLRRKLRGAGWADLAAAIRGHNGRYVLSL